MTAANVNGITIEYDVHGDDGGDPLLLVMGLGGQLIGWPLDFVDRLVAKGFRVIRFDNRDIGLSTMMPFPPPTGAGCCCRPSPAGSPSRRTPSPTWPRTPPVCSTTSASRGPTSSGMSMGGMIGQAMAIRHPDKVASLTSIMSHTGDRKHGKIKRSLLRKLPKLITRNPDDAVANGVEMFRLISGPHFDADARPPDGRGGVRPQLPPRGRRPPDDGHRRQPGPHVGPAPGARPDARRARAARPAGDAERRRSPPPTAIPGAKLVMYPDMGHDLPRPRWDDLIDEIVDNARKAGPDGTAGDRAPVR